MSYTASRRPTLASQLGSWAGTAVAVAILWLFTVAFLRQTVPADSVLSFWAQVFGWVVVAVVIHESGHLTVGLALGAPVRKIRIGSGATLVGLRVRGLTVQICLVPFSGAVYFSSVESRSRGVRLATVAAGPLVNLIAFVYAFPFFHSGASWLEAFVLANLIVFVSSATPAIQRSGGQVSQSDGMQIFTLIFRSAEAMRVYEGGELTEDAYAVLAHAGEEAQLAGALEITDEDLLRALNRDPVIGALFASFGLNARIPAGQIAETDEVSSPRPSTTLHEVLTASIRACRDMGIPRPNAASFCLGLLAVDCPAGRLMRDAGITDDALRRLIAAAPKDEAEPLRAQVISADLPVEKWGTAAEAALSRAIQIAVADRSPAIGTEDLVAAVAGLPESRGGMALERLRFVLEWKGGPTDPAAASDRDGAAALSAQAALALAGALWRTGPNSSTGTAEILLGIVDQNAGLGAQLLRSAGIGPRSVEKALRYTPGEASQPAGCTSVSLGLWMLRGNARVGAERWLDARADFLAAEAAATTNFQRALCHNNIAWVSLMAGDPSLFVEALERSRAALAVKPDQISFIGTHAFALLENGSPAEAATLLESTIPKQSRPRDRASDLCLLAMCRVRLGRPDLASAHIAEATAADPKCALLGRARAELEKAGHTAAISS